MKGLSSHIPYVTGSVAHRGVHSGHPIIVGNVQRDTVRTSPDYQLCGKKRRDQAAQCGCRSC